MAKQIKGTAAAAAEQIERPAQEKVRIRIGCVEVAWDGEGAPLGIAELMDSIVGSVFPKQIAQTEAAKGGTS